MSGGRTWAGQTIIHVISKCPVIVGSSRTFRLIGKSRTSWTIGTYKHSEVLIIKISVSLLSINTFIQKLKMRLTLHHTFKILVKL